MGNLKYSRRRIETRKIIDGAIKEALAECEKNKLTKPADLAIVIRRRIVSAGVTFSVNEDHRNRWRIVQVNKSYLVACPTCGAPPGKHCVKEYASYFAKTDNPHDSRLAQVQ